jgi:hypothetical protein
MSSVGELLPHFPRLRANASNADFKSSDFLGSAALPLISVVFMSQRPHVLPGSAAPFIVVLIVRPRRIQIPLYEYYFLALLCRRVYKSEIFILRFGSQTKGRYVLVSYRMAHPFFIGQESSAMFGPTVRIGITIAEVDRANFSSK